MQIPISNDLPKGWVWTTVERSIEKVSLNNKKLKKRDYKSEGKLPVIDQGMSFIGGYTDNEELKLDCQIPVAVFGDHTKVIKYVNFDFVAGADGIKVIKPQKIYHPKLFYYFIQSITLPDKGYARHFQFLEKAQISLPPLEEQQRIVAKLETLFAQLDSAVNSLKKAQVQLQRYRRSLLKAAFEGELTREWREGHSGECQSVEDSTGLPKDWERTKVGCVIKNVSLTGKKLKKKNYELDGELPVIDQGLSFIGGYTNNEELKVECELPVIVFGDHTKAIKYVDFDFVGGADGIKVIKSQEMYHPKLFYYFIRAISLPDRGYSRHFQFLEKAQIPIPPLTEQVQIIFELERCFSVDDEVEATIASELRRAERLRQSILKHAFSGKLVPQDPNDGPASVLLEKIQDEKKRQPKQQRKTKKIKHTRQRRLSTPHISGSVGTK